MSALDGKMGALAAKLVYKFRKAVVFRTKSSSSWNATDRTYEENNDDDIPTVSSPPFQYINKLGESNIIEGAELYFYLASELISFNPELMDEVIIDGRTFTVIKSVPMYSGELIAAYVIYVKR